MNCCFYRPYKSYIFNLNLSFNKITASLWNHESAHYPPYILTFPLLFNTSEHDLLVETMRYRVKKQKQPPEIFYEKGFLKIFRNSQENTCGRISFLIKLKRDSGTGVFH